MDSETQQTPQDAAAAPAAEEAAAETPEPEEEQGTVEIPMAEYRELKVRAEERDQYLLRLQRAVADYQNLLNRMDKVREAARKDTLRRLAEGVGPLADTVALALEAVGRIEGAESITEGLLIVEKELYGMLALLDIEPITSLGEPFDPHYHEAVMHQPSADAAPGTVVCELKKGFKIGDHVIRPAQVAVAKAPETGGDA